MLDYLFSLLSPQCVLNLFSGCSVVSTQALVRCQKSTAELQAARGCPECKTMSNEAQKKTDPTDTVLVVSRRCRLTAEETVQRPIVF